MRGFTFVELMVVITIVVILVTMAIPIYNKTIIRSKETVLHQNLFTLRTVIDNYTFDKTKAPQTLVLTGTVVTASPATNIVTITHSDQFDPVAANNSASAAQTPRQSVAPPRLVMCTASRGGAALCPGV